MIIVELQEWLLNKQQEYNDKRDMDIDDDFNAGYDTALIDTYNELTRLVHIESEKDYT